MARIRKSDGTTKIVSKEEIWGAEPTQQEKINARLPQAKSECRRRIFVLASADTQRNITAAAAVDLLTVEEKAMWREGLIWVAAMRANWKVLARNLQADIYDDANWPSPPGAAVQLAEKH